MERYAEYIERGIEYFKRYKIEAFFVCSSLLTISISIILFSLETGIRTSKDVPVIEKKTIARAKENEYVYVDVSGAVKRSDMYRLKKGSRFYDLLEKAGGLSENADIRIFQQYFNRAKLLADQEKYYIPSVDETPTETNQPFFENAEPKKENTISINNASEGELDTLPGVGEVTIEHIIQGRPYASLEELLTKKVVKQNVFDDIKPLISL